MPKIKFTKAIIDKLPPPVGASDTYFAEGLPGFGLRVGKTKKTFFVQKDILGRACTYTITDPVRAQQYLMLSSLAMYLLDEAEVRP